MRILDGEWHYATPLLYMMWALEAFRQAAESDFSGGRPGGVYVGPRRDRYMGFVSISHQRPVGGALACPRAGRPGH